MINNINVKSEINKTTKLLLRLAFLLTITSCKKLATVDAPPTSLTQTNIYSSDATAISVLTGLYTNMANVGANPSSAFTGNSGISLYCGLSSDELSLWSGQTGAKLVAYYQNNLSASTGNGSDFWSVLYRYIFTCNSAIEGVSASSSLSVPVKPQLLGEAKFLRALNYFYLVNLFGDVPLALSSDPVINGALSRAPQAQVWQQIISDLHDAQNLLSSNYIDGTLLASTTERVRPTKWAATAMLARAYLYTGNYVGADSAASAVIDNSGQFGLTALNNVFLKNSTEAIWQLQAVGGAGTTAPANTFDGYYFIIPSTGFSTTFSFYINPSLVASFETGDNRKTSWMNTYTSGTTTYYYPYKYKQNNLMTFNSGGVAIDNRVEYLMMLRLGEQYLIRAEARAHQNNLIEAASDLNILRARSSATLSAVVPTTQASMLTSVAHERQVELFTELGQRWLDLKRTKAVDAVMTVQTPLKSNGTIQWNTIQQLYPILASDIIFDPNLVQNPGY